MIVKCQLLELIQLSDTLAAANQALNLNPEIEYALVQTERGLLLMAAVLVESCMARYQLNGDQNGRVLATTRGKNLALINFKHPLYDVADASGHYGYRRFSPVYLADYATAQDGTGLVHSSPAYGVDDFNSCKAHGLNYQDILNPVGSNGAYAADFPLFGGQHIWKAVPVVIEALRQAGRLLATQDIQHSYPHCWRHKSPVIYRAAAQWFIRMDEADQAGTEGVFTQDKAPQTLRQLALAAIEETRFYPENGKARLRDSDDIHIAFDHNHAARLTRSRRTFVQII
jgi:isoleucyl-tRNA synthetase